MSEAGRFGHYEILGPLGAGGMGEVFRARDPRLGREVALKRLPDTFAADKDRLARFRREAQLLAALNHPHIAAIHGLEEADGQLALVLELVEGETLDARIRRGPVPVEEALPVARQIAEALEAAHEKGIIHRDLKPANVKLTPDGTVKLLDFGLAKAWEGDAGAGSGTDSHSPTLSAHMTEAGLILGTAAYMSPEQARGRAVDKRADIWAFGVVLYEMLTGRRLFDGETVTDVLAAVVRQEIDWSGLPPTVPPAVRALLRRCLERDPRLRLRDIGEARIAFAHPEHAAPAPPAVPVRGGWTSARVAAVLAFVLFGWAATGVLLWRAARRAAEPVVRYEIAPPEKGLLSLASRGAVDVSADGSRIVFAARMDGVSRLYLRDRGDVAVRPIPGTEGASGPAFSPDGTSVAFFGENTLRRATLDGSVATLAPATGDPRGLTWVGTDRIVFAPDAVSGLLEVSASGGATRPVSRPDEPKGERTHRWPHALPGGRAVLFTVGTNSSPDNYDGSTIAAVDLSTGARRDLLTGARMARYAGSGHLLFARGSSLHAVRFDPGTLVTIGSPWVVLQEVDGDTTTGASHFACAGDGTLVYVPGTSQSGMRKLAWVAEDGAVEDIAVPPGVYNDVRLSPDGQRFAVAVGASGSADIWIYDVPRQTFTRFTFDGVNASPVWTADGRDLYFASVAPGGTVTTIRRRPADGSREAEPVATVKGRAYLGDLEPGGRSFLVITYGGQPGQGVGTFIGRVEPGGAGKESAIAPIVATPADEYGGRLSPDGRWLAFQSDVTGTDEVYVQDLSGTGARWQISSGGGEEPNWSLDGRRLFYRDDTRLMAVPVETKGRFTAGRPALLVEGIYNLRSDTGISMDVPRKGGRFLMVRAAGGAERPAVVRVVLRFLDTLARAAGPSS